MSARISDPLPVRLRNLVIALAVAYIDRAVELLEAELARGPVRPVEFLVRLDDELRGSEEARRRFVDRFGPAFREELSAQEGHRAGAILRGALEEKIAGADLVGLAAEAERLGAHAESALAAVKSAQDEARRRNTRMIRAIATQGLESIATFDFVEKLKAARAGVEDSLTQLERTVSGFRAR